MGERADGLIHEALGTIAAPRGFYQEIDDLADKEPQTDNRRKSGKKSHANDGQNPAQPGVVESEDHPWWTIRHKHTGSVLAYRRASNPMRAIQLAVDDHNVGAHPSRRMKPGHFKATPGRANSLPPGQVRRLPGAASVGESEQLDEKFSKEMQSRISAKIEYLKGEGQSQEQAVATALNMARKKRLGPGGKYKPVKEGLVEEEEFSREMQGRIQDHAKKLMANQGLSKRHAVKIAKALARDGKLGKFGYRKPRMTHNTPQHLHHGRPHGTTGKPTKNDSLREMADTTPDEGHLNAHTSKNDSIATPSHATTVSAKINKAFQVRRLKVRKPAGSTPRRGRGRHV